jgi:hypothetical protein
LRAHCAADDEIWIAAPTRTGDGRDVNDRVRALLFAIAENAIGASESEPCSDWPSGRLEWYEVARFYVR